MIQESRRAEKSAFTAAAEVELSAVVRKARVKDLSIHGCYLAMPDPFSKGASVRIKIRTEIEFFQTDATVANAAHGLGMEVLFRAVSPPFLLVLQHWLSEAQQRIAHHKIAGYSGREFAMEKKAYAPPRVVERLPDQVPKWIKDKFNEDSLSFASAYTTLIDGDRRYVQVSNAFCELLGYKSQELIGKRFDELTAPRTSDIPTIFGLFKKLGYMQGLWLFVHRTGKRILIRYEAWLRPDSLIESNIEVVDHLR